MVTDSFNDQTPTISTNGNRKTFQFLSWLYKDSKIELNRKFNYKNLVKHLSIINDKTISGTQWYPKSYLNKYGKLLDVPYDETNTPDVPNLYNHYESKAIVGPEGPLTAKYIWNKRGYERNKLVEWVFDYYRSNAFPNIRV